MWGNTNRHGCEVCTQVANWSRISVCQVEIPNAHQNRAAVESQCSGCVCESAVSLLVSAVRSLPANLHASLGAAKPTLALWWGGEIGAALAPCTPHAMPHKQRTQLSLQVSWGVTRRCRVRGTQRWDKTNAKTRAFQLQRKPPHARRRACVTHTHAHITPICTPATQVEAQPTQRTRRRQPSTWLHGLSHSRARVLR